MRRFTIGAGTGSLCLSPISAPTPATSSQLTTVRRIKRMRKNRKKSLERRTKRMEKTVNPRTPPDGILPAGITNGDKRYRIDDDETAQRIDAEMDHRKAIERPTGYIVKIL